MDSYNYLPKDELKMVAERLNVPLTQIYSVATFYTMFSLVPKGDHQLKVCLGTACHLRGGESLVNSLATPPGLSSGTHYRGWVFFPGNGWLSRYLRPGPGDDDRRQILCPGDSKQGPEDPEAVPEIALCML